MPSHGSCSSLINDAQHQGGCANLPTSLGENPVSVRAFDRVLDHLQAIRRLLISAVSGMHVATLQ
jgi:hypothetical protein